ncbi:hypothetical protein Cfor_06391 [Coptotermes formosanus]|uniref:Kazal-type serine protease inhibitor domain-containing protein 1 n=1 Tax=Coptotermes formosanus TaxID=36987 RepID=A0A6L2PAX9_COPFO|nr:hypothetical protein Cfor_06391 [Coptotermes formosanus]
MGKKRRRDTVLKKNGKALEEAKRWKMSEVFRLQLSRLRSALVLFWRNARDEPEALCYCKETQEACGSDNRTYESVCQMNEASAKSGNTVYLKHWGPCRSVPWVTSGPEDVAGALHQGLALDCEVKGYPIPGVHWEFQAENGNMRVLPSDDLYVAVQVRGGPEPFMVTSWVQIVDLRPSDTGIYTCVASNSEGEARASAKVGVRG